MPFSWFHNDKRFPTMTAAVRMMPTTWIKTGYGILTIAARWWGFSSIDHKGYLTSFALAQQDFHLVAAICHPVLDFAAVTPSISSPVKG